MGMAMTTIPGETREIAKRKVEEWKKEHPSYRVTDESGRYEDGIYFIDIRYEIPD